MRRPLFLLVPSPIFQFLYYKVDEFGLFIQQGSFEYFLVQFLFSINCFIPFCLCTCLINYTIVKGYVALISLLSILSCSSLEVILIDVQRGVDHGDLEQLAYNLGLLMIFLLGLL
jgi:hypothetical protein